MATAQCSMSTARPPDEDTVHASASKVVVQAAMSLDGFIAGPGDSTGWVFEYTTPGDFPEVVHVAA